MSALVVNTDARHLSFLADESVDEICTSPPYWAQRSYREGGEHYEGQIGSEPHPRLWLEAMWDCAREWWRVLKPSGSVFVNLGDKRAGSGGHNNSNITGPSAHSTLTGSRANRTGTTPEEVRATRRNAPDRYQQAHFGRVKSRQLLPERFAIGMEDGLGDPEGVGWIVRQVIVWEKLNGLPESVTDRTRDNFEYIYHFTKSERYYSAVDEIREPGNAGNPRRSSSAYQNRASNGGDNHRDLRRDPDQFNPLGKLPGSVWRIASEPLAIPEWAKAKYRLPDHFACVDEETEVLTRRGWLRHGDLAVGDEVAGYDLDAGLARWTTCHAVNRYPFDGELVSVEKRDLSMRLTPNHRCLAMKTNVHRTRGPLRVVNAEALTSNHFIPRSAEWEDFGEKSIGENMAALCGWVAAEGWYSNDLVYLSQSASANAAKVAVIDALLGTFPFQLHDRGGRQTYRTALGFLNRMEQQRVYRGTPWTEVTWRLPLWLGDEVRGLMPEKRLGMWALELPEGERRASLDAFIDGDGHRRPDGRIGIFQKEQENLDVLQAIAVTLGYKTTLRFAGGRWVLYLTAGLRSITLRGTNGSHAPIPREHYRGIVWCPTTGTGTFVARRNGSVFITGNSFPSELPRRLILGWSPPAICLRCGEGRRPVVEKRLEIDDRGDIGSRGERRFAEGLEATIRTRPVQAYGSTEATIVGYVCACCPFTDHPGTGKHAGKGTVSWSKDGHAGTFSDEGRYERQGPWREWHLDGWTPPPSHPAVVLDPFGGTGTTAGVANALGRDAIITELSEDYCRLARWRLSQPSQWAKATARSWAEAQGTLL